MQIDRLTYGVGLDLSQLDRDAARADQVVNGIGGKGGAGSFAGPSMDVDTSRLTERMSSVMKGAGGKAFMPNFGPMTQELDRVGGAIITMFRRIDSQMKFPGIDQALTALGNRFLGVGTGSARAMAMVVSGSVQATAAAARHSAALGVVVAAGTTVGSVVVGRMLAIVGATGAAAGVAVKLGQGVLRVQNYVGSLGDVSRKTFTQLFHIGTLGVFRRLGAEASGAQGAVGSLASGVRSLGRDLLVAFGVAGLTYKLAEGIKGGIKAASDLNESVAASKEVFGDSFGTINAQVEDLSRRYGLLRRSQIDAATGFGSIAQGAGYAQAESARFGNTFTALAADLASNKNLTFEEATGKLTSALAGESEPLRRFGVLIDENSVKAYALSHGLATSAGAIDNHAKMAARAALIQEGLKTVNGDLARTADSTANQFRRAGGGMANFAERIGQLLLPAVNLGVTAFNELLASALEVFEANLPMIQSWAGYLTSAMEGVGRVVRNLGAYFRVAQLRVGEFAANAINWLNTLPENFGPIILWIENNWANMLRDLIDGTAAAFTNLATNAANFGKALWSALSGGEFTFEWTPMLDGFYAATQALPELIKPELISVQDEIDQIWAEVDRKEAQRAANVAKLLPKPKDNLKPAEEAKKDVERKLAAAVEIGSKESYSIIQSNRVGNRNDGIKSVAQHTKATADTAREHLNWVKNHPNGFSLETAGI